MRFLITIIALLFTSNLLSNTFVVSNVNNSGTGSLRTSIASSSAGDTIKFSPILISSGNATILLHTPISINNGITIIGLDNGINNLIISGRTYVQIFSVNLVLSANKNFTIDSLILNGGNNNAGFGGAISFYGDSINILNSIIQNCRAVSGGAIFSSNPSSHFTIKNAIIKNNYSTGDGAGLHHRGLRNSSLKMINSEFISNNAGNDGGGIYFVSDSSSLEIEITNSKINNNRALANGGGLYSKTYFQLNVKINGTEINTNRAIGNYGGGLYLNHGSAYTNILSVYNTLIQNNSSHFIGGGILTEGDNIFVHIKKCLVKNNSSNWSGGIGAWPTSFIVDSCDFVGNSSSYKGACIDVNGITTSAPIVISNSNFIGNNSNVSSGSIVNLEGKRISVENTKFRKNGGNGLLFLSADSIFIENSTIDSNSNGANASSLHYFQIKKSTVSNNYSGTAVRFLSFNQGNIEILKSTITDNKNGVSFTNVNNASINSSTIVDNQGVGLYASNVDSIGFKSTILGYNLINYQNPISSTYPLAFSEGHNIFETYLFPALYRKSSDYYLVNSSTVKLLPLDYNGGINKTRIPDTGSIAINSGDSLDLSDAQNRPIIGKRDIGAAEYNCILIKNDTLISCKPYTWRGLTCRTTGVYKKSNRYSMSCDSIFYLYFTLDTGGNLSVSHCDSIKWKGTIYDTTGLYYYQYPFHTGCAIDTLNLVILKKSDSNLNVVECFKYTSPSGKIHFSSGVYIDTVVNHLGCDSIVTVNLTINSINSSITLDSGVNLISNEIGAAYKWLDCNNGYLPLVNDTNKIYRAALNGSFAVEITKNNCVDTSSCYAINSVGLNTPNSANFITIFPNPNNGNFIVDVGNNIDVKTIFITDLSGRLVKEIMPKKVTKYQMNFEGSSGIYVLNIITDDSDVFTKKIVKY